MPVAGAGGGPGGPNRQTFRPPWVKDGPPPIPMPSTPWVKSNRTSGPPPDTKVCIVIFFIRIMSKKHIKIKMYGR